MNETESSKREVTSEINSGRHKPIRSKVLFIEVVSIKNRPFEFLFL